MATDPLSPVFYVYILRRPDREDPFDSGRAAPFYIGKGCNGRIKRHRQEAIGYVQGEKVRNIHKNNTIVYLWKNGKDYEVDIVTNNVNQKEALNIERKLIAKYGKKVNSTGILTNYSGGGEGVAGYNRKLSEKEKDRLRQLRKMQISSGMKGRHHTDETKEKISKSRRGQTAWNKDVPADPDLINKMHDSWTGKKQSPEALVKISNAGKKHWSDPEYKAKMRETMKRVQNTPEYRRKLSESVKKVWAKRKGLLVEQYGN